MRAEGGVAAGHQERLASPAAVGMTSAAAAEAVGAAGVAAVAVSGPVGEAIFVVDRPIVVDVVRADV